MSDLAEFEAFAEKVLATEDDAADLVAAPEVRAEVVQAAAGVQATQALRAMSATSPALGQGLSTGNQAVDAAVQAVRNAAGLPVAEQFAAYEAAHQTLREVLASIEE